ncbi:hypothetical protein GE21DRAFT_3848 [Neurospora crassa]|uniref:Uncharacterized protein n=1 Tax=Neurospora crassa (strain ATCC 24698 / 74-OR23-1A / CBS 708.71 / DSM 1257 / FGSC 987) TaxID=367110 RepID=Q7S327_NEUCR|nr:hypothetical protein NCU09188 [Neurospora crassa OR74A]EAA29862.1 hypothetical protein NCU09188 [Neurospora crassa OR74A]KHE84331.1 hypothetical protein GE21DRAFT_3848 [Neurospora crassa]|eukprot:XP_959098.1 hypothetical protein NCU09188 [Neurospora crassa OR74A]
MGKRRLPAPATQSDRTRGALWPHLSTLKHFRGKSTNITPSTSSPSSTPSKAPSPGAQQTPDAPKPKLEPAGRIRLSEADVLNDLRTHKGFGIPSIAPGLMVTDLPNFDDVTPYGVTEQVQEELWELEAKRLVKAVTQEESLLFEGSDDMAIDSKKSYAILAVLADRMMQCLNISTYDGESLLAQHHEKRCDRSKMQKCKLLLSYLTNIEDDVTEAQKDDNVKVNDEDFFKFVDYCTSVSVRLLCSAVDGRYFQASILAQMARFCTKVKVLSADLKKYAQISLDNAEADSDIPLPRQQGMRGHQGGPDLSEAGILNTGDIDRFISRLEAGNGNQMGLLESASKKKALRFKYCEKCDTYRLTLTRVLEHMMIHLRGTSQLTQTFPTSYEVTQMIYETGFERSQTMVFQDEENNFLGTSDPVVVNYCRNGIHLLNQTLNHLFGNGMISECPPDPPSPHPTVLDDNSSVGTTISWDYSPDRDGDPLQKFPPTPAQPRRLAKVESMSNIITIIVPLLLANPSTGYFIQNFFRLISFNNFLVARSVSTSTAAAAYQTLQPQPAQESPFEPHMYGKYTAFFSLTTEEYRCKHHDSPADAPRPLSKALMRRKNLHRGDEVGALPRVDSMARATNNGKNRNKKNTQQHPPVDDGDTFQRRIEAHQRELDRYGNKMKSWVAEEKGIMVQCKGYVALTMLFCIVLVSGGIAVGVSVGPRISAVDPFNITTYCWVLAAFIVLVAKSVRVHDWPWNDFLHGRVLCKSVSELSSVTGIGDQLILAKLLQDESLSRLETRGPFNAVFRRRKGEGFSIDRPISMWTMLLSGLIMIEVESVGGKSLVCLDLRRGTAIERISSMADYQEDEEKRSKYIHCRNIPGRKELADEGHRDPNKLILDHGDILWIRSLGFYSNKDAMFI